MAGSAESDGVGVVVDDDDGYKGKVLRQGCGDDVQFAAQAGVVGLDNLGNSCYMNAGLQCLSHIEPFAAFFLSGRYKDEINEQNVLGCKGELAKTFAELQTSIWTSNKPILNPKDLRKKLATFAPHLFEGFDQQDVQEFLAFCLDGLHEDLNRARKEDIEDNQDDDDDEIPGNECGAALSWMKHLEHNKSFLVDLFQGQLRSSLTCTKCGHKSWRFDPFLYLSLPVSFHMKRMTDALEKYLEEESLTAPDQWHCVKCNDRVDAVKKIDLWHLPPVLVIHLKRFEFDAAKNRFRKIGCPLDVPLTLDLSSYCSTRQKGGAEYDVTCVANHKGPFGSGHYTATCRVGDTFLHFDDQTVSALAEDAHPVNPNAYVLFLVHRSNAGSFAHGHNTPVVHRQTVSMPELWPQRFSVVGMPSEVLKHVSSDDVKDPDKLSAEEATYTLSLPDLDLNKLHSFKRDDRKEVVQPKKENGGCVSAIMKVICGGK